MVKIRPLEFVTKLLAMVLAFSVVNTIFFTNQVSASILKSSFSASPLKQSVSDIANLEVSIKTVSQKIDEKESVVTTAEKKLTESKTKAEELKTEVLELQQTIAKIDGMFVHINKYSIDAAGNRYAAGNCTYWVKQMRPDISNSWGNANSWYANASAQGWNVGALPKKGAIATTSAGWAGHVAYVTGVSLDQQWVTISEMNYGGLYAMNTRTVYYTEFRYIYELN